VGDLFIGQVINEEQLFDPPITGALSG